MRAVQITRFGGPEVMDVVDLPDPEPGTGEELFEVSAAGINYADPHQYVSPQLLEAACLCSVSPLGHPCAVAGHRSHVSRDIVTSGPVAGGPGSDHGVVVRWF
ncbi:MAG: hypothetical protein ACJ71Y_12860 [Blastococcus sp.]